MTKWHVMGILVGFSLVLGNPGGGAFAAAVVLLLTWND